ncbi:hypothetical protein PBAC_26290 [Pedobacter glucosidilyticus]|nr:hypothetical protein [Pedobacter glucosidilyticus]KHJ37186.1 hypothetical protein PBAC_26290 [Pedobacter glucosidilyticus]
MLKFKAMTFDEPQANRKDWKKQKAKRDLLVKRNDETANKPVSIFETDNESASKKNLKK